MVETVGTEEFVLLPQKKKIEDYEFVKVRLEAGVARMTLSRPEHNLLNEAMLRELAEGIEYVGSREDIKIILLDSACKVFCGGIEVGGVLYGTREGRIVRILAMREIACEHALFASQSYHTDGLCGVQLNFIRRLLSLFAIFPEE